MQPDGEHCARCGGADAGLGKAMVDSAMLAWPFYLSERKPRAAARKELKRRAVAAGATMWADF